MRAILQQRPLQGEYNNLVAEMRLSDSAYHQTYFRMSADQFDDLLRRVGPLLVKKPTHKLPIGPGERLALTLR
jgi:hypothetical protein